MISSSVREIFERYGIVECSERDFDINTNVYVIRLYNITYLKINDKNLNTNDLEIICDELVDLKILFLNDNNITNIPNSLNNLANIKTLSLNNNNIHTIPDSLDNLSNLKLLSLNNNNINTIPNSLANLNNLKVLSLNNNNINTIPNSLANLNNLEYLFLGNNPILKNINNSEYNQLDAQQQIKYLLKIQSNSSRPLNELKVLVVGDENVGKTKIIERWVNDTYDDTRSKTTGIDIVSHPLQNGLKANIWDFAGQEIAHQTHQYFMSSRSLYLLVLTSQNEDDESKLYRWLNTIKSHSKNSQIVIVVNQIDMNYINIPISKYNKEFNVVDVCYVSAKSGEGFCEFKKKIEKYSSMVENVAQPFPNSWSSIKEWLEKENSKNVGVISNDIVKDKCKNEYNIPKDDIQTLLSVLNAIGTIVKYTQTTHLKQLHILNPKWISVALYKMIEYSKKCNGIFRRGDFCDMISTISEMEYESEHFDWLRDLVVEYEAGYEIDRDTILIPLALEDNRADIDIKPNINFRYDYKSFLRKNIIAQAIVKLNHLIDDSIPLYKSGVVLKYEDSIALIEADYNNKNIDITIQTTDDSGAKLLAIIRDKIDEINKGLDVKELIPIKSGDKIIAYKSYKFIKNLKDKGKYIHELEINDELVECNINSLLNGYDEEEKYYTILKDNLIVVSSKLVIRKNLYRDCKEDEINDEVCDLLEHKYTVKDQSRGGDSQSGKSAGERDIVIVDRETQIEQAVIEGYKITSFDNTTMDKHYKKLRDKYDAIGNRYKYMLVYVVGGDFSTLWSKYIDKYNLKVENSTKDNIKCGLSNDGKKVYHYFINLN
jgi:small GTP-binding protein